MSTNWNHIGIAVCPRTSSGEHEWAGSWRLQVDRGGAAHVVEGKGHCRHCGLTYDAWLSRKAAA